MFFTKYTFFAEKMFVYGKKSFILIFSFTEKKYIYLISKYISIQKMFVSQIKYKSFLNIYSF